MAVSSSRLLPMALFFFMTTEQTPRTRLSAISRWVGSLLVAIIQLIFLRKNGFLNVLASQGNARA